MNKFLTSFLFLAIITVNTFAEDRESPKVDKKDFVNESALHDAVRSKNLDMVKFLLDKNANVNIEDEFGYTPLHLAVRYDDQNITDYLLENGALVNTIDTYDDTPLLDAIRNNNTQIAKELICRKATRDVTDQNGMSTLHYATKNDNIYLAKLLTVDYIELYCQDKIEISIDKIKPSKNTTPSICGKIDIGYVSNMNMSLTSDEQKEFGPYNIDFDNKTHTWCADVKDELPTSKYVVNVNANDFVVNEANASSEVFVYGDIAIDINKYEEPLSTFTPNICGTIKNSYASKIELSVSSDLNESQVLGKYDAEVDNKNKSWCAKVATPLDEGNYKLKAFGVDDNNNSSTAFGDVTISSGNTISIDPVKVYNDNTPLICGKVIKGDILNIELSLESETGVQSPTYSGVLNQKEQTWCVEILDELENGLYTITANGYDEKARKATAMEDTNIYLILGLYEALNEEFSDDFAKWNAELDKDTLTFRFKDPSLLFNPGRSVINEKFEAILSDFFPRYVKIVQDYKDEIQSVRVEGHSSSEHSRAKNDEERFELNRKLSQKRAEAVIGYAKAVDNEILKENLIWIENSFNPIGMSYSKLIYNLDGSENKELSRRVEFKIETKNIDDKTVAKPVIEDIEEMPTSSEVESEAIVEEPVQEIETLDDSLSLDEQLLELENQ